jgi:CheY-like chemotaxis protein
MNQIYIAEDNPEFAEYIAKVALLEGWKVEICPNGKILSDKVREESGPAFLLVDITMPEMDGIEAIEQLVGLDRPLRIRFMTGGAAAPMLAAKMIAKARELNVGSSIYKPISKDNLTEILRQEATELSSLGKVNT